MAQTRHKVSIMIDDKLYTKLNLVSLVYRYRIDEKELSMSEIVNRALSEYFVAHKNEIDEALEIINKEWRLNV